MGQQEQQNQAGAPSIVPPPTPAPWGAGANGAYAGAGTGASAGGAYTGAGTGASAGGAYTGAGAGASAGGAYTGAGAGASAGGAYTGAGAGASAGGAYAGTGAGASAGSAYMGAGAGSAYMGAGAGSADMGAGAGAGNGDAGLERVTIKGKFNEKLGFHILMVAVISLLLLIPSLFFSFVLADRKTNEFTAIESMVGAWGDEQRLNDIELLINTEKFSGYERDEDGNISKSNYRLQRMQISPVQARNLIVVDTQKRYRGNYEASLYNLEVTQEARFDLHATLEQLENLSVIQDVLANDLRVLFSISDTKGIDEIISLKINNKSFMPQPALNHSGFMVQLSVEDVKAILEGRALSTSPAQGAAERPVALEEVPDLYNSFDADKVASSYDESTVAVVGRNQMAEAQASVSSLPHGFGAKQGLGLGLYGESAPAGVLVVEATYLVRGSQKLIFAPIAQISELELKGTGVVPSFAGDFLPREREVDESAKSFTASYYQNNLATGHAAISEEEQFNKDNVYLIGLSDTSESYVLIERLTKYVLLFIAMTYVAVLAFEITSARMVSLVQYVVIGAALILFYMVLLSLSEHFSFTLSYLVAALLMSSMIALYLKAVLSSKRDAACVFVLLLAMYALLFAIVHIETYALLVGTALLVVMLGIVMFITRKLNTRNLFSIN